MKYWRTIACGAALAFGGLAVWAADSWKSFSARRSASKLQTQNVPASGTAPQPAPPSEDAVNSLPKSASNVQPAALMLAPPINEGGAPILHGPLPDPESLNYFDVPMKANNALPPPPTIPAALDLPSGLPPPPPQPPVVELAPPDLPSRLPPPALPQKGVAPPADLPKPSLACDSKLTPLTPKEFDPPVPPMTVRMPDRPPPVATRSLKLSMCVGGPGSPRFEIHDDELLLLKVTCDNIALHTAHAGAILPGLSATGHVTLHGSGLDGACEQLAIDSETGEVVLKGNVRLTCFRNESSSDVTADKLRFQLLRGDGTAKPRSLSPVTPAGASRRE